MQESRARRMWRVLEPYHAITYFAPDTRRATDALGLRGGWMSYFACRAAPLGPVGPELVTAVFYTFHPSMVARAIPDAWTHASPAQLVTTRLGAVDRALHRLLPYLASPARRTPPEPPVPSTPDAEASPRTEAEPQGRRSPGEVEAWVKRAAEVARRAADLAPTAGRPMAAANAALEWADEPHLVLWQAATILRESRGDGHVSALVNAGLSPCQACLTISATGGPSKEVFQLNRRWSDDEWTEAAEDLRTRGLLDADGALTERGHAVRQQVEDTTDRLAEQGWKALGHDKAEELDRLVRPISSKLMTSGFIPPDNPMALRWPTSELT